MTYNQDIPQADDDPSESQGELLMNFMKVASFLGLDHEDITDAMATGKHKQVHMPRHVPDPAQPDTNITAGENEAVLYAKGYTPAGGEEKTRIYYKRDGMDDEIPLGGMEADITAVWQATGPNHERISAGHVIIGSVLICFGRNAFRNRASQSNAYFSKPFASGPYLVLAMPIRPGNTNDVIVQRGYYVTIGVKETRLDTVHATFEKRALSNPGEDIYFNWLAIGPVGTR